MTAKVTMSNAFWARRSRTRYKLYGRESRKLAAQEAGDFGLVDFKCARGLVRVSRRAGIAWGDS